jgi:hypothetical protein
VNIVNNYVHEVEERYRERGFNKDEKRSLIRNGIVGFCVSLLVGILFALDGQFSKDSLFWLWLLGILICSMILIVILFMAVAFKKLRVTLIRAAPIFVLISFLWIAIYSSEMRRVLAWFDLGLMILAFLIITAIDYKIGIHYLKNGGN